VHAVRGMRRSTQLLIKPVETLRQTQWVLLASGALIDFFAMNDDVFRCADADAHQVGLHAKYGHGDVVADHQRLTHPSRQYQHDRSLIL